MSLRIAGMGKTLGMAESDVVALSATLSSLGIRAEMGGSAISTTMSKIASEISRGTEKGQKWAEVMGMSIEEVQHLFEVDAYGALIKMVEGLEKVDASGGNVDATLRELGVTEIRQLDVMKRLIGSSGELTEAQRMAADEYRNNNELLRESEERYQTFESQMQKLKNGVENIWSNIGGAIAKSSGSIISSINDIIDSVSDLTDSFFDAEGGLTQTGEQFVLFAKVIAPIVTALGIIGAAFMLFGPAGAYVVAITGGLGLVGASFFELEQALTQSKYDQAMDQIATNTEGKTKEAAQSFMELRDQIQSDLETIQLNADGKTKEAGERIVENFRQMSKELQIILDEEEAQILAYLDKRIAETEGKEKKAFEAQKQRVINHYDDISAEMLAGFDDMASQMKNLLDENGRVNEEALNSVLKLASAYDEKFGTSLSASYEKMKEFNNVLDQSKVAKMTDKEVTNTVKDALEDLSGALRDLDHGYEEQVRKINKSIDSDEEKALILSDLEKQYRENRDGIFKYAEALVEADQEHGKGTNSLNQLNSELSREVSEILAAEGALNENTKTTKDYNSEVEKSADELKKATDAHEKNIDKILEEEKAMHGLKNSFSAFVDASSDEIERFSNLIATDFGKGFKEVDLGQEAKIKLDEFKQGLEDGTYDIQDYGLAIVNKYRQGIGLESLNHDGMKKVNEFVDGISENEPTVEQIAKDLGISLKDGLEVDTKTVGTINTKDFVEGLRTGEYGAVEVANVIAGKLEETLRMDDLSAVGKNNMIDLANGLKLGLIDTKQIGELFKEQIKEDATVELGDKGKYTIGTLVEGLASGELQINDVMEGVEALMEEKSKIDLTSQAQETMNGYVNAISEQTGLPVEEIESMIKQMYEATGSVDFSAYGIEVPQEIADGVNTEAPKLYQTAEEMMQQLEESLQETEGATEAGQQIPEDMSSGIDSTFDSVIQSAENLKESTKGTLSETDDGGGGENAGKSFLDGLLGWITPARASAAEISDGTEQELGTTDDGGGGTKAGENFTSSLAVYNPIAMAIANNLKSGTETELGATTDGNGGNNAGEKFTSGLQFSLTPAQQVAEMSKGSVEGTLGVTSDGGGGANAMETFASQMFTFGVKATSTAERVVSRVQNSLGSTTDGGGGDKAMSKFNTGLSTGGNKAVKSSSSIVNRVKNTLAKATDGKGGNRAGNQFYKGIQSNVGKIQSTSSNIVNKVKSTLARATDGNGGNKVGREFTSGIRSFIGSAGSAAASMASGARSRIAANSNTFGLGANFGSGFVRGIRSYIGAAISAATALARSALNAVKRTQRSASPSKETIKLGGYFGDGFALAIEQSSKKAEKASKELARSAMSALDESLNTNYGEIMSSSINGFDVGENNLQRELIRRNELEMSTREDINVNVVNQINGRDYEVFVKDVSNEIDKQKKREARF